MIFCFLLLLMPGVRGHAQGRAPGKPEVENYDLRGQGYTQDQIGATAKAHAKGKLVLVAHVNKDNERYQNLVLDIVGDHIRAGRTKIMVLFAERKEDSRNAVYFFADGDLIVGVFGDASDYGLALTQMIRKLYTEYLN